MPKNEKKFCGVNNNTWIFSTAQNSLEKISLPFGNFNSKIQIINNSYSKYQQPKKSDSEISARSDLWSLKCWFDKLFVEINSNRIIFRYLSSFILYLTLTFRKIFFKLWNLILMFQMDSSLYIRKKLFPIILKFTNER